MRWNNAADFVNVGGKIKYQNALPFVGNGGDVQYIDADGTFKRAVASKADLLFEKLPAAYVNAVKTQVIEGLNVLLTASIPR